MNKEVIISKLQQSMVDRATSKMEAGKNDFPAYPLLGKVAVSLVVGIGEKSDDFYNLVNQEIVAKAPSHIYAIRSDTGSGQSDGMNRVRVGLKPIADTADEKIQIRAISPLTQTE